MGSEPEPDMLSSMASALIAIQRLGYLNEFSTMVDTWFVAHSVPGGDAEDAIQIKASIAYLLIHEKLVTEVGRGTALGDNGCRLVWYALRQDEEKPGSEAE
jgi:hypothetical protein